MNWPHALIGIAKTEALRLIRARAALTLLVAVPAVQVLLFGYAIRPTDGHITVAIAAPTSAEAQQIADHIRRTTGMTVRMAAPGGARAAVHDRAAAIGIEVPPVRSLANPFAARIPVRIIADATEPVLTDRVVAGLQADYWRELAKRADVADSGPGIAVERLYNPGQRADWTFLPALIGVTTMIAMVLLGTLQTARERETGSWEAIAMLPLSPLTLMTGRLLPYVVIGMIQGLSVLALGVLLFDLPVRGSVAALGLLLAPFAAAHYLLGATIASRARTQIEAVQSAIAFYLPAMLLSGFLYPFATLPAWAQSVGTLFPLTHFLRAARGATLRGDSTLTTLGHGGPILLFLAGAMLAFALSRRVRID